MAWGCCDCGRQFVSRRAFDQHSAAVGHREFLPTIRCYQCPRGFYTQDDADEHMSLCSPGKWRCEFCHETASTEKLLWEHEAFYHRWCSRCQRSFQNMNNAIMHFRSYTHLGSTIGCPFCKTTFTTAAGLAHHLERGSCLYAPNLNRDKVYRLVRKIDPQGYVAKNLLGWEGSVTYTASERSWNGYYYQCYFCHRNFNTLYSLNQHLASPVHQQKYYHCPNPNCRKEFTTLAAVCNHLESESCGYMRFETVQTQFQGIMRGDRLITYQ
ncbi:hypothetical protein F4777DRAFT_554212 [Nemania sp. FL0916]|nr:hypothetical protein F4777DRAFT_554212 [Nemania sp. FL0916]